MKRRDLQIEEIGTSLLAADALTEVEIDRIASKPFLYSSIKATLGEKPVKRSSILNVKLFAAFASLAIIVSVSAAILVRSGSTALVVERSKSIVPVSVTQFSEPDRLVDNKAVIDPEIEPNRVSTTIQRATYRRPTNKSVKTRKPAVEQLPDIEFYPLTYSGDPNEVVRGGRVIRVDLSRASLFAMGIDVQLENGAETVRADLLVGPDGVPRGIRMPN
ncbi:MAG: hypothetical protein ACRD6X_00645 [Pyrinomonadaceae bacterium]